MMPATACPDTELGLAWIGQLGWGWYYEVTAEPGEAGGPQRWRAYRRDGGGLVGAQTARDLVLVMARDWLTRPVRVPAARP